MTLTSNSSSFMINFKQFFLFDCFFFLTLLLSLPFLSCFSYISMFLIILSTFFLTTLPFFFGYGFSVVSFVFFLRATVELLVCYVDSVIWRLSLLFYNLQFVVCSCSFLHAWTNSSITLPSLRWKLEDFWVNTIQCQIEVVRAEFT